MNQQTVEDFLDLPGIIGVALMDGHSRPYFCGIDQALNYQQKEALTQGIQQVINTTPASFESFDFRFAQRDARIYKLVGNVILLVVTNETLDMGTYQSVVTALKTALQAEPHNAVANFRLFAGGKTIGRPEEASHDELSSPSSTLPSPTIAPETAGTWRWEQAIASLNALTDATAQYLGKIVVANTWRSTRPESDALAQLQLDRNGHFSYSPTDATAGDRTVSATDQDILSQWVKQFIKRCSMIIRDYADMVLKPTLDEHQRLLLKLEIEAT